MHDQSNYFDQIVQRYHNTIAGQFYGHTHQDQFAIAYSNNLERTAANAVSVGLIAPALTPRGGNPCFKMYDVDPDTYEIMDARVFMSDLSDPTFQTTPTWRLSYSARETYGPLVGLKPTEPLSPGFWHGLTEAFVTNDTAFQQYIAFKARGMGTHMCWGNCKTYSICDMRTMRVEDKCNAATLGLNFSDETGVASTISDNDCEPMGIRHILTKIVTKMVSCAHRGILRFP